MRYSKSIVLSHQVSEIEIEYEGYTIEVPIHECHKDFFVNPEGILPGIIGVFKVADYVSFAKFSFIKNTWRIKKSSIKKITKQALREMPACSEFVKTASQRYLK